MDVDKLNSFFGEGAYLNGKLTFKGLLRFDGQFEGEIISDDTLVVGETGSIDAKITTGKLNNFGKINGEVVASKKIILQSGSILSGKISSPLLEINEGSLFDGSCAMPDSSANNSLKETDAPDYDEADIAEIMISDYFSDDATISKKKLIGGIATAALIIGMLISYFSPLGANTGVIAKETTGTIEVVSKIAVEQKASEIIAALIKENGNDPALHISYANALHKENGYPGAIEALQNSNLLMPDDNDIQITLATSLYAAGLENDARRMFANYAKKNRGSLVADAVTGYEYLDKGFLSRAKNSFERVIAKEGVSNTNFAKMGLALIFTRTNQEERAIDILQSILAEQEDYAPALNRLAWIYSKNDELLDEAKSLSKKSLAHYPDIPEYLDTLSEVSFRLGEKDEAIRLIKEAIQIDPAKTYYKRQLYKFQQPYG